MDKNDMYGFLERMSDEMMVRLLSLVESFGGFRNAARGVPDRTHQPR